MSLAPFSLRFTAADAEKAGFASRIGEEWGLAIRSGESDRHRTMGRGEGVGHAARPEALPLP